MRIEATVFIILIINVMYIFMATASTTQSRPLCYTGSSLYQRTTQDCSTEDSSYTGMWYCATIKVCESFISSSRQCIETRGCATEQECQSATSSSGYYDGEYVQVTAGINPGGMEISLTCCEAHDFPTDDTIAIDYKDICNTATTTQLLHNYTESTYIIVMFMIMILSIYFS